MADRRRIVTFSAGNRPVLEVDLEVGGTFQAIQNTFAYQPGDRGQQTSRRPGRWGGQKIVGEQNDNGTVSWQALVQGATNDVVAANVETLLASCNGSGTGRRFEWRPDGATYSSYFRIAGPAVWKPTYSWGEWQGAKSMIVEVTIPVEPLVLWDPMTIGDPLDVDSRGDYTFDALTSADVTWSAGKFSASASLSTERRARHTIRGYQLLEGQVTSALRIGTLTTGVKAGVLLRGSAASTYVEVYIDDNGTNSRLRVDVVIAGVRTNRATVNLAARMTAASTHWVRGRIEGSVVYAEHFSGTGPTPMGAPADSISYTLVSGDAPLDTTAGYTGWSWVPADVGTTFVSFEARPFTYRNQTLPQALAPTDVVPGKAPALANVLLTPSGGSAAPAWGEVAWAVTPAAGTPLFGSFDQVLWGLTGWAQSSQAGARGGFDARASTSGAGTFTATLDTFGPFEADDFQSTVDLEVWARVLVSSGNVNPRLKVSAGAYTAGLGLIGPVNTVEYGATGKLITKPSSGTAYRYVRLGTVTLDTSILAPRIVLTGTVDTGSTGVFGFNYVTIIPARRRAAMMTGVAASTITSFVPSTSEWTKTVKSDLSSTLTSPPSFAVGAVPGLGGTLIEPNPGAVRWHAKLSSLVPDDPTSDTTTEQTSHSATFSVDVTPRSYMFRGA